MFLQDVGDQKGGLDALEELHVLCLPVFEKVADSVLDGVVLDCLEAESNLALLDLL